MPEQQPEQVQPWYCDHCAAVGTLRGPNSVDVLAWTAAREQSHAKRSPECHQEHGAKGVRVLEDGRLPA